MLSPMKHAKNSTSFWDARRGVIHTKKGGWVINQAVHNQGYSMLDDLVGEVSYFQVLILNVVGRLPERRLADWLEAYFICLSWPDSRIWCNQIGSLAGTLRATPVSAIAAGIQAADSKMYGPGTAEAATLFITDALKKKANGFSIEDIINPFQRRPGSKPIITGFARPVASGDERIPAMERVTQQLGFSIGAHLQLAYEIEELLFRKFDERMNIAGYRSAFLSDQGLNGQEIYRLLSTAVSAGVIACYTEAADLPPESFYPLQCVDIDYRGPAARPIPEQE